MRKENKKYIYPLCLKLRVRYSVLGPNQFTTFHNSKRIIFLTIDYNEIRFNKNM